MFDRGNKPGNFVWSKSNFVNDISEEAMDTMLKHFEGCIWNTNIEIMHLGGAIKSTHPEDSAFYFRNATHEIHSITTWESGAPVDVDKVREWCRNFANDMSKFSCGGGYSNIFTDDSPSSQQFGKNFSRLQSVKSKYDPHNRLHFNHNIPPIKDESSVAP
jgi:FAD/FMN-containing dehydrogenase